MREEHRERRDWSVIILVLFFGILLMLVAGQRAIQLLSHWTVNADMGSNLNPNLPYQVSLNSKGFAPIKPGIMTPAPWKGTYLTPGSGTSTEVVPLQEFDPSSTPEVTVTTSPTPAPPTSTQATGTSTSQPTNTSVPPPTETKKPKPPKPTNPPPTASPSPSPSPSPAPTLEYVPTNVVDPPPAQIGVNQPPDGNWGTIQDDHSVIIDLGSNPIVVTGSSDTNYDLVYYERVGGSNANGPYVAMDSVIVGISPNSNGDPTYPVFNWGDNVPDQNTNVDTTTLSPPAVIPPSSPPGTTEADNAEIATSALYQDSPSSPQTGILIDVDNAPSHPPAGSYQYVVVSAPASPPNDGNDGAEVDAVQVVDVPPTP